jgi:hypothetical protein
MPSWRIAQHWQKLLFNGISDDFGVGGHKAAK